MRDTGDASDNFEINLQSDADASIARVFFEGEWHGDLDEARDLLSSVSGALANRGRLDFLVLYGGFLVLPWPDTVKRWSVGDPVSPPSKIVDQLLDYGESNFRHLVGGAIGRRLGKVTRHITMGVDLYFFMGSVWDPHAELTFAADLDTGQVWRTGKSYPNPRQQHGLIRVADLQSHFIDAGKRKVMLLGCHDMNMFSPRSAHNARGWRSDTIREFKRLTAEKNPDLLIWHPHKSDTPRTWLAGLCGLKRGLPGISYAGAGIYYNDGMAPRASLSKVLQGTKNIATLDIVVKRKRESRP
ncbi:hypothetical protein [Methanocella arvoryzae]|nr:hypothetical protein [Methanocella arvoryzae]